VLNFYSVVSCRQDICPYPLSYNHIGLRPIMITFILFCDVLSASNFHHSTIILRVINLILNVTGELTGTNALNSELSAWWVICHQSCFIENICNLSSVFQLFLIFIYFVQNIQFVCGPTKKTYNIPTQTTHCVFLSCVTRLFFRLSLSLVSFLDDYIWFCTIRNIIFKYFYCWAWVNLQGISTHVVNGNKHVIWLSQ
jgi:hypothetical protein